MNETAAGLSHLKAALEANLDQGQYWLGYIDALMQAGYVGAARNVLEQGRQQGLQGDKVEWLAERLAISIRSSDDINILVTQFNEERFAQAEIVARTMTERCPQHAFGWKALGAALQRLGNCADALAPMQTAVALAPGDAEAHFNLGNSLSELGRLDEAENSYRRVLEIKPDDPEAHNSLGNVVNALGRHEEADARYRYALKLRPTLVDASRNLALLLYSQGNYAAALSIVNQSLQIEETSEAKKIYVACIKRLRWTHENCDMRAVMVRALTEPWDRPKELVRLCTDLVKLNPTIGECVARAVTAWPVRLPAQDLFGSNALTMLADDPLLSALLTSAPVCEIEMERFLTMARSAMLRATIDLSAECEATAVLGFYSALARQCYINEYVFASTDDEDKKAGELRKALVVALQTNAQVPLLWPLVIAAYFPLSAIPLSVRLLETEWPEAVTAVLVQQVCEPEEAQQLRASIPRLTGIDDGVSLLVRNQYEENPYPRWVKAAPAGEQKDLAQYLSRRFPLASFDRNRAVGCIDVLIAGCGTGQHSIQTAQQFSRTNVLAVDLSLSSLAYAKRKTRELGLTSVEYAQADLLKLGSIGRSFDVIESVGVLHHLADPLTGWQLLLSLLRPGGFMRLGFYSEVARHNIVKARALIAEHDYGATAGEIRRCRQDLMSLAENADFRTTISSSDFFSVSTCRDLLFHAQEHRMTLVGIDSFLRDNNLVLLGFEIEDDIRHAYRLRFPEDRAATNLETWQIFENENPATFGGMYQFWIQK